MECAHLCLGSQTRVLRLYLGFTPAWPLMETTEQTPLNSSEEIRIWKVKQRATKRRPLFRGCLQDLAGIHDTAVRHGFVRKVYGILSLQLIVPLSFSWLLGNYMDGWIYHVGEPSALKLAS